MKIGIHCSLYDAHITDTLQWVCFTGVSVSSTDSGKKADLADIKVDDEPGLLDEFLASDEVTPTEDSGSTSYRDLLNWLVESVTCVWQRPIYLLRG